MDHAMTSNEGDAKVHLLRILFEHFCHLRNHLQSLLLSDALIWIHDVFVKNPSAIRPIVNNAKKLQHFSTIFLIIEDLKQVCICLDYFSF